MRIRLTTIFLKDAEFKEAVFTYSKTNETTAVKEISLAFSKFKGEGLTTIFLKGRTSLGRAYLFAH